MMKCGETYTRSGPAWPEPRFRLLTLICIERNARDIAGLLLKSFFAGVWQWHAVFRGHKRSRITEAL